VPCVGGPKEESRENVKMKAMGMSDENQVKVAGDNRKKNGEWTYCIPCPSPQQCSSWKDPR
jgi:hypothetical protein